MATATAPAAPKRRANRDSRARTEKPAEVDATVGVDLEGTTGTTDSRDSRDLFPPSPETDIRVPLVPQEQRPKGPVPRLSDADGIEGPEDDEEDDPESPYISFIAATKRYDISRQALHTLCVKGKIPFYLRYNGRRRFLRSEADEYLGLTRVEATDPLPKRGARA